jgi:tripartite-type tricarboxylate transporter receptor subunit TctC
MKKDKPMKNFASRRHAIRALAWICSLGCASVFAQSWPSGPLKIIVPYPPGGSSDIIARAISQPLSEALKQSVVVENRPGANGNLGADAVAKSKPDGLTLLLCDTGALAISPSVYTKLAFDPSTDLRGVTMLAYSPHMLVVHPSVPANNLQELVALSKKTPINFAVTAMGSAPHLAGVAVQRGSGASWVYIPYKGGVQAVTDTMAGQTQVVMNGMLATWQHGHMCKVASSKSWAFPKQRACPWWGTSPRWLSKVCLGLNQALGRACWSVRPRPNPSWTSFRPSW